MGKGKPLAAVVEQVGNGSTLRVTLLEDLQYATVQVCTELSASPPLFLYRGKAQVDITLCWGGRGGDLGRHAPSLRCVTGDSQTSKWGFVCKIKMANVEGQVGSI